jgi:hypothetical protein
MPLADESLLGNGGMTTGAAHNPDSIAGGLGGGSSTRRGARRVPSGCSARSQNLAPVGSARIVQLLTCAYLNLLLPPSRLGDLFGQTAQSVAQLLRPAHQHPEAQADQEARHPIEVLDMATQ